MVFILISGSSFGPLGESRDYWIKYTIRWHENTNGPSPYTFQNPAIKKLGLSFLGPFIGFHDESGDGQGVKEQETCALGHLGDKDKAQLHRKVTTMGAGEREL